MLSRGKADIHTVTLVGPVPACLSRPLPPATLSFWPEPRSLLPRRSAYTVSVFWSTLPSSPPWPISPGNTHPPSARLLWQVTAQGEDLRTSPSQ